MKTNIYGVYMSLQEDREAAARAWFEDPSVDTVRLLIAHIGMGNGRFRLYHDNANVVLEAGEIPRYDDYTEHEEIALTSWLRFAKKDAENADTAHARPARAVPQSPAWRGRDFTSKGESMSKTKKPPATKAQRGAKPAPRVPRTVLVTERMASALDRGETVTITGATKEVCDG